MSMKYRLNNRIKNHEQFSYTNLSIIEIGENKHWQM